MYKKLQAAITWNTVNVFTYKILLLLHQIVLFYYIPKELYGTAGTIFACVYLLIGCTNLGFDYSLFTFFKNYLKSKQACKKLLVISSIKIIVTLSIAALLYQQLTSSSYLHVLLFKLFKITLTITPYLIGLFVIESIKKYIETMAQLAFLNKQITIIQITALLGYISSIWIYYAWHGNIITLHILIIPLCATSLLEIIALIFILLPWYTKLPPTCQTSAPTTRILLKNYGYNAINQLSKNIFSPNFLTIIIAYHIGMRQTATVKFFTNIASLFYMLLNRSLAIPTGALLAHLSGTSLQQSKHAFITITNNYVQLLYGYAITSFLVIIPCAYQANLELTAYLILLFIILGLIEYIPMLYEKLYLVEQTTDKLALLNGTSLLLGALALYTLTNIIWLLCSIGLIRISFAGIVGWYAYKKWHLLPIFSLKQKTILASVICASVLYFFHAMTTIIAFC